MPPQRLSPAHRHRINGTPRFTVANALTTSGEYRSILITASYRAYLGRQPDPAGLAGWLNFVNTSGTIVQMDTGLLGSTEYYLKTGATPSGFIASLYVDTLHRVPSSGEVLAWVAYLNTGVSRDQVALQFLRSTEHLQTVVDGYYMTFLHRAPDPIGRQAWVRALQTGARNETVIAAIIARDEYYLLP